MKRIFNIRLLLVAVIVATLISNRLFVHHNLVRLTDDLTWVTHSHHVLDAASDVLTSTVDAETGQRGFLVTGNDEFLEPYNAALARLGDRLSQLRNATEDNPRQLARATQLADMIAARLARLQTGIEIRRQGESSPVPAPAQAQFKQGKVQMDAIRAQVKAIKEEEYSLLAAREQQTLDTQRFAVWINIGTGTTALFVVLASAVMIGRNLAARRASAEALQRAHLKLQEEMHERSRIEHALRESERIYRAIGESIDYGVWLCEPKGKNTYASQSFLKLVGLTQEECSEFGWAKVLHPDDAQQTLAAWQECVRTRGTWDREHRFRGTDGAWHPLLARGVPVEDEQGQLLCWAGINLDISRMKLAEQELREAHDKLEARIEERTLELTTVNAALQREVQEHAIDADRLRASLKEKEVLLKEVHHRVKNNLQIISSLLYMQSQRSNDQVSVEMFSDSRQRVHSMALVHERLYRAPDLAQVDFAGYLANLAESLVASYRTDSGPVRLLVEPSDVWLPIDAAVPCGLLANELISNCLKHAFRGRDAGTVRVAMRNITNGEVQLSICDDGVGLPADVDPETSLTFGMQIVMALVEQLHASLHVVRDGGTEFRIQFPLSA